MDSPDAEERENQTLAHQRHEDGVLENMVFTECVFQDCVWANVEMRNLRFANCVFERCVLRNVAFQHCAMLNSVFQECSLVGLDWSRVRRHGTRLPLLTRMSDCTIKYNTFVDVGLAKMDFTGSALHDCYFQDCGLKQALFRRCDLEKTVFHNCDLAKADFRDARNYAIDIAVNRIGKARFSQPDVVGLLHGVDIIIEQ